MQNILLGIHGAANVFGPQKGATPHDVKTLEAALTRWRDITLKQTGKDMTTVKHGGAAGGVAAGLSAYLNVKLVNGIDYFLQLTGFTATLQTADIVITGEGSIDEQTLQGKGPYGVAVKAKEKNIPVIGVAGSIPLQNNLRLQKYFDVLMCINNDITDIQTALQHTEDNLVRTGKMIGDLLTLKK